MKNIENNGSTIVDFGIDFSGYYLPVASLGVHPVVLLHEHDITKRYHYKMTILPCAHKWEGRFYLPDGVPIYISLVDEPRISVFGETHYGNSQNWRYSKIETLEIKKGWIFVDGVDVYDVTKKIIDENKAKKLADHQQKFAKAKTEAINAGFTEDQIEKIVRFSGKGQIIAMMNLATRMVAEHTNEFILEVFGELRGTSPAVIEVYSFLAVNAAAIRIENLKRATEKAEAWSYLYNLVPCLSGLNTKYFSDVIAGIKLALARNVQFGDGTVSFGEYGQSILAEKLREAGLAK